MKATDPENLIALLECFGAWATGPNDQVTIPRWVADEIKAILLSLPGKAGRPKLWSASIERRARLGLLDDRPIRALAREISAATGQPESSVRRRLQEMKASRRLKELKALKKAGRVFPATVSQGRGPLPRSVEAAAKAKRRALAK